MRILGFDYPDERFYDLEHDMWCLPLPDGRVRVGVSGFGVHLSGDFYMCRPKPPGTVLAQGQSMGVVELSKTIVTIRTPVSGSIAAVNPLLEDSPDIIHRDPYGAGWLVEIAPSRWEADLAALSHGAALEAAATARMRREPGEFP